MGDVECYLFFFRPSNFRDRLHLFHFVFMPWGRMVSSLNDYSYRGNYNSLIERMNGINEIKHIHA